LPQASENLGLTETNGKPGHQSRGDSGRQDMTDIDWYRIIKWVLIVLSAGFVGQFGKSLASHLIQRARGTRTIDHSEGAGRSAQQAKGTAVPPLPESKAPQAKAEKKAAKNLIKMRKKEDK
jgi:hypothetical protein